MEHGQNYRYPLVIHVRKSVCECGHAFTLKIEARITAISLSLQKVRNFAHFLGIFKYRIHHEILNLFEYSLFACRHRLIKYALEVSDVVYRHLEVVVGALKKTHIFTIRT